MFIYLSVYLCSVTSLCIIEIKYNVAEEVHQAVAGIEKRLDKFGLFPLEHQRLRDDLIDVYKIMKGIDRGDSQYFYRRMEMTKNRRYSFTVREGEFKEDLRQGLFVQRVVQRTPCWGRW